MLINPTQKLLIPTSLYTKRIVFRSSSGHTEFEDDPEDIFGLGGCKRDKRFYARCYRLLELDNDSSQDLVRHQFIKLAKSNWRIAKKLASTWSKFECFTNNTDLKLYQSLNVQLARWKTLLQIHPNGKDESKRFPGPFRQSTLSIGKCKNIF